MAKNKKTLPVAGMSMPTVSGSYKPSKADVEREKKYQAEDDLRLMQRMEELKKDKSRVSAAKTVAKEQMAALNKVCK